MNNKLTTVLIIIVLVIGGFLLFNNRSVAPTELEVENNMPVPGSEVEETEVIEETAEEEELLVREFTVDTANFSFSPSNITVNQGETVKITVKNTQGFHDFRLDKFNVATKLLNESEEQTITFVADEKGTFEYYCSVGNHRDMGMVGSFTVL